MIHNQHCKFYIASCEKNGGIYLCEYKNGEAKILSKTDADRPMYLTINEGKLYSLLRQPFQGDNTSGVVSYDISSDSSLVNPSKIVSTKGIVACHLTVFGGKVYCVNYLSGNVVKIPDVEVIHEGSGISPTRQDMPHTHYINSFDGKYLICTDLGTDTLYVYDKDLIEVSRAKVPEGHGARHLAYSQGFVYCVNELESTVSTFLYNDGYLEYKSTVSALPDDFNGVSTAAAIRVCEGYIYVSNRGHDSISVLKIENGIPFLVSCVCCGGESPRDFNVFGDLLVCTNEKSNNVTFFEIVGGVPQKLDAELEIPSPLCVIEG